MNNQQVKMSFCHGTYKMTGSAINFWLRPATANQEGAIFAEIAMQVYDPKVSGTLGRDIDTLKFDWVNKMVVNFTRDDLVEILQTLKGYQESIANGKGLFHRTARANTVIKFYHQLEPRAGYMLSISRKTSEGNLRTAWIMFSPSEAMALMMAIEQSMLYVCFGIPQTLERPPLQMPIASCGTESVED